MKVFLVEDNKLLSSTLKDFIENNFKNLNVEQLDSIKQLEKVLNIANRHNSIFITDIYLKDGNIKELSDKLSNFHWIVMTGQADVEEAVQLVMKGAYDFFSKPVNLKKLKVSIRNLLEYIQLSNRKESNVEDFSEILKVLSVDSKVVVVSGITGEELLNKFIELDKTSILFNVDEYSKDELLIRLFGIGSSISGAKKIDSALSIYDMVILENLTRDIYISIKHVLFGEFYNNYLNTRKERIKGKLIILNPKFQINDFINFNFNLENEFIFKTQLFKPLKDVVGEFEKNYITFHLKMESNVKKLSERLKIPRTTLLSKIKRYGIRL